MMPIFSWIATLVNATICIVVVKFFFSNSAPAVIYSFMQFLQSYFGFVSIFLMHSYYSFDIYFLYNYYILSKLVSQIILLIASPSPTSKISVSKFGFSLTSFIYSLKFLTAVLCLCLL